MQAAHDVSVQLPPTTDPKMTPRILALDAPRLDAALARLAGDAARLEVPFSLTLRT